jgi:4-carboxymuconolactone decarboxylase
MGPWNPWLHEPVIGRAIWKLTLALTAQATLPDNIRQIAILVVGARFDAAYEIYAHIAVAEREGMKAERLATLVADLKPTDLVPDERVAFDFAYVLARGGTLPEPARRGDLRPARNQRADLSCRSVLPGVDHAQCVQRAVP